MKRMKKVFAFLLTMVMVLAMAVPAMAQTVDTKKGGNATITIKNPAKGETYNIHKLFDATTQGNVIAYQSTGDIPTSLTMYFTKDSANNVTATSAATTTDGSMSEGLKTALQNWASASNIVQSAASDGSTLSFTNLPYGYYVITTTHGQITDAEGNITTKSAITVDSTKPDATIYDKNSTETVANESKKAYASLEATEETTNFNIGDTVYFKVSFNTANYKGSGSNAQQITKYVIEDTLPEFLEDVAVDSITVGGTKLSTAQFGTNSENADTYKKITIDWVNSDGANMYADGAEVVITYHATLADSAEIDGNGNTNSVTITPYCGNNPDNDGKKQTTETIYTYAIAIKKVNQSGTALKDATFQLPFYVKETADATDGAYIYAGTENGEGLTNSVTTPENGIIIVKGLKSGVSISITETAAPAGYNKLTSAVTVIPTQTNSTTTNKTWYLENGEVKDEETESTTDVNLTIDKIATTPVLVVNTAGSTLPSTGGIGTTLFYVIGAICVLGAGVLLVTRRRMASK